MAKPALEFSQIQRKDSRTRTLLYGDQQFNYFEQQIWHTRIYQRLYYIRQLGFSDRVFPDAVLWRKVSGR